MKSTRVDVLRCIVVVAASLFFCAPIFATRAEDTADELARDFGHAKREDLLAKADKALAADPENIKLLTVRARMYSAWNDHENAVKDWTAVLKKQPHAGALQMRGCEYFFAGKFAESIADFDAFIKDNPEQSPHHWQRGIALYYAKRYADGRKQFAEHKAVNPDDVENAAWHFICAARDIGFEKARADVMPIETQHDARVPMKEIYALFQGKAKPEAVIEAAKAGDPDAVRLKNNLCYAHLYLGLYYEAAGDAEKARDHIKKSAVDYAQDHYMGKCAQVHWKLMQEAGAK